MESRARAYVGLGSNEGSSRDVLASAVHALAALPEARIKGVSRLYRTKPVGPVTQRDFLNAVVGLSVPAGPTPETGAMALLLALKGIERALGRVERERWGPREVDLDLLLFGDHAIHVERDAAARSDDPARSDVQWLDVPHVSARERLFVLAPLADLAADLVPPGWQLTVAAALDEVAAAEAADSVVVAGTWDAEAAGWSVALAGRHSRQ